MLALARLARAAACAASLVNRALALPLPCPALPRPRPAGPLQSGNTALHRAAAYGHRDAAEALLRAGAAVDAVNADGATPVLRAARWGHDEVVGLLLAHGAKAGATDASGRTAAEWAAAKQHAGVAAALAAAGRPLSPTAAGEPGPGASGHALRVSPAASAAGGPGHGGASLGHLPAIGEDDGDDVGAAEDLAEAVGAQYVLDGGDGAGDEFGGHADARTSSDGDAAALGDEGGGYELGVPLHVEGWMAKQGQIFKTWKNRWFVLEGRAIYYYAREGAPKPKGVIAMAEGTDVIIEERYAKPFCFTVSTPGKRYILQAADDDEMAEWIEAIQNNLECCAPGADGGGGAGEDGEEDD